MTDAGSTRSGSTATALIREVALGTPDYQRTVELRRLVLLDPFGIPLEKACADDGPAVHLAAFDGASASGAPALGCLLIIDRGSGTWQLRQMAVLPELQGKGLGRRLVEVAWERAREAGC